MTIGSKDAELNGVVAAGPRGQSDMYVMPGAYQVLSGIVYSPQLGHAVALIDPKSIEPLEVTAGQPGKLQIGGPYKLEFTVGKGKTAGQFAINPATFKVKGRVGEVYTNVKWVVGKPPTVGVVVRGDKTGGQHVVWLKRPLRVLRRSTNHS